MPKRTPEQKLARQLQRETGQKYMVCLRIAQDRLKELACDSTAPSTKSTAAGWKRPGSRSAA